MGSNEGRTWMSLGGVGHVELIMGFLGLRTCIVYFLFPLLYQ